jgi:hypothetical protein
MVAAIGLDGADIAGKGEVVYTLPIFLPGWISEWL